MRLRLLLCTTFAALALAACGEEKIDVPEVAGDGASTTEAAGSASPQPAAVAAKGASVQVVEAVEVSADAVHVGTSVDSQQAATGAKKVYTSGDIVHASIDTRAHPGTTATVYWSDQSGIAVKTEKKAISGTHVAFLFSRADGMKPGNYNVGIDVDDVPVGLADFKVQ
jgi:hypothetical protein